MKTSGSEETTAERVVDVLVVGSGAAGMSAALTAATHGLATVIIEKSSYWGGSSARSGGGVWIPDNPVLRAQAPADDLEDARRYLHGIVGPHADPARIDAYLDRGAEALTFLIDTAPLHLEWVRDYADYYPEAPGGRAAGRSCEPLPFDTRRLGADAATMHPPYSAAPTNLVVKQSEYRWISLGLRTWRGPAAMLRVGARALGAYLRGRRLRGLGAALMGELMLGVRAAGVPVELDTALTELITENDRVVGARVERDGRPEVWRARHGIVLACGGFEHNAEMRRKYQREPVGSEWTTGAPTNTGDGITAALKLGAAVRLMDDAWWGPAIPLPEGPWFALTERSLPRSIIVDARGERFMNESLPYVEAVHRMYGGDFGQGDGPGEHLPAWLIFDKKYRNRYMFATLPGRAPLPKAWLESGVLVEAATIAQLAERIGVPAAALTATVERFNGFADNGVDEDFRRGESVYDHYYGDIANKPNPSLGPLTKGPFYAARLVPGDLGTKGGIDTDAAGRALRADGSVIAGLYAAGNTSAPVMGHTYAGPGATIGPALVFGYLAALDIAGRARG
ncbi:3-oxosteroid 1-dehydrogenase [Nocardia otitidiscaviarum]|uniref:3-oxosteroid 1-dehydrogenase n=1 Tax=Nocardia otitidiscaviarum TaxID=1823 RepID=UPI002B4AD9D1|nr:3-oxosteroid 1-dehydrogenase [Nocardia otitidiscaviarum]